MTIKKYISYNGMYQTDFSIMSEAAFKPYSAKVRKDIFCSVIIAEGGHQKKFKEKYKKLQVPALKFFPRLLYLWGKEILESEKNFLWKRWRMYMCVQ